MSKISAPGGEIDGKYKTGQDLTDSDQRGDDSTQVFDPVLVWLELLSLTVSSEQITCLSFL